MTKIALLSDIHGNSLALEAVLVDIETHGGVDKYWVLGDLVAIGPDPVGVLERLHHLPQARFVRGNTDRYVVTGSGPFPVQADVENDLTLLPRFEEVVRGFAWTQGAVTVTGWFDWLAALPLEQRLTLPDGTRLLGVHASPGEDDGCGLRPDIGEDVLQEKMAGCGADLVIVGHTHWAWETEVAGIHVINLGGISNPHSPDRRASYIILEANETGYRIIPRRVDYDREAVIAECERVRFPGASFVARLMRGEKQPVMAGKYELLF